MCDTTFQTCIDDVVVQAGGEFFYPINILIFLCAVALCALNFEKPYPGIEVFCRKPRWSKEKKRVTAAAST
jgi:hypothetical protein